MNVLLLSAGYGKRLLPITENIPKCLVEINGSPILKIWIEFLLKYDSNIKIYINIHYLAINVVEFVKSNNYNKNVTFLFEQVLLGTAGTIIKNYHSFKDEPLLVIHADNLSIFNLELFKKCYDERNYDSVMTMMTFRTDSPEKCGIVKINKNGSLINFFEKKNDNNGNLANAAIYIMSPELLDNLYNLHFTIKDISLDLIPIYLNKINTFENTTYHRDIGDIKSLQKASIEIKSYINNL
jgi:mannose-1-phosphate guanylyltransferase